MGKQKLREVITKARKLMEEGEYRKAFDLVIDVPAEDARDLFNKVACLTDIGFVLRDEKVLRYGIYLLENHGEEIAMVPEYTPFVYINLANQYANMGALYSYNDDYWSYYRESELDRAKNCYLKALDAEDLNPSLKGEIYGNLASVYLNLGRRWEALECYEYALSQRSGDRNYLEKKCSLMLEEAHFNDENRQVLFREVYGRAGEVLADKENYDRQERFKAMEEYLEGRLSAEEKKEEEIYPSGTLETENSFQHYYVGFCVKKGCMLISAVSAADAITPWVTGPFLIRAGSSFRGERVTTTNSCPDSTGLRSALWRAGTFWGWPALKRAAWHSPR